MIQLDLFAWGAPKPREVPWGWRVYHPCACGSTHGMLYLAHPFCMLALRHWRLSRREAWVAEMMAARHAARTLSEDIPCSTPCC